MNIRKGTEKDLPFIEQMLFEAFFWDPNQSRPDFHQFHQQPEFQKLLSDWGRPGDRVVIADDNGMPIGAAWYRFWTEENHSYGYVNPETPELGIGILADYRSKGIGRILLRGVIDLARREGIQTISLSVDPLNYARNLYETEGFVKVGESGTSWTMMAQL